MDLVWMNFEMKFGNSWNYLKMNDWKGNFLEKNCAHRDEMEELSKRYIYR